MEAVSDASVLGGCAMAAAHGATGAHGAGPGANEFVGARGANPGASEAASVRATGIGANGALNAHSAETGASGVSAATRTRGHAGGGRSAGRVEGDTSRIPPLVWPLLSLAFGLALWMLASARMPGAFASPAQVGAALAKRLANGTFAANVGASLPRVLAGFGLAFVTSIPVAFLMAWHDAFRRIVEPWIQFVRNIPPLAYVFIVIAVLGIGQASKIAVIFVAAFLVMVVTMYQGVRSVDPTLIKAARVLGATQRDLFLKVVVPASEPYVFVSARLGLSAALTTLMASEIVGGDKGIGVMIQQASGFYQMDVVLLGVLTLGVIGVALERIVRVLERRLTGWQETLR